MKVSLFYLPVIGSREEMEAGMAGLRRDLYQRMLHEVGEQARLADDLGYDSINFTEHHFHVEGFEVSQNPVMLDLFVGMQTKRIRVGQLGIVLPAQNPIRVAEDIAMLDHMTGGRANAGFARGYQRRWVDVMAQHCHGVHGALPEQHDDIDTANREAFEEAFRIVKACWTVDMLEYEGKYWRVPVPGSPWPYETTQRIGAGVEDGIVKQVAVVPKPLQQPHPPLFQPFASSENSVRWCAREGITAVLPPLHPKRERELVRVYAEEAKRAPGDGVALLRDIMIADTDEEAQALWRASSRYAAEHWFTLFGFRRGTQDPDTGEHPSEEEFLRDGYCLVGSVDTVCRQIERMAERVPVEWIFGWIFNGMVPHATNLHSLEAMMTQVLPKVGLSR